MKSFTIAAQSAWSTLQVCDRQARKDTRKIVAVLTSRQAMQTYRAIWNLLVILGMVAIALGSSAREFLDNYVERCLTEDALDETVPTVEECLLAIAVELSKDARKLVRTQIKLTWIKSVSLKPFFQPLQSIRAKVAYARNAAH